MPSNAWNVHLEALLEDADVLIDTIQRMRELSGRRAFQSGAVNRSVVLLCVSAWEAYIEEVVREALEALRPASPPLGLWPALNATVRSQLGRFNNPNVENVRMLLSDSIGLPDIQTHWAWRGSTMAEAVARLATAMAERHQIAHGTNPRPAVTFATASRLPGFFRKLARATDDAIRRHLVTVHGIAVPWPP